MGRTVVTGHVDVYALSAGFLGRARRLRLRLALRVPGAELGHVRRTPDRWGRRWQAEHTGRYAYLGATRRWTRTGAFIAHTAKVKRAEDPRPRRTAWRDLRARLRA